MKRIGLLLGLAGVLLAAPAANANDYMVVVTNYQFEPSEITIFVGDTIGWRNVQGLHSTTSDTEVWDYPAAVSPWGFAFTFFVSGDYPYYCTIHGGPGGVGQSGIIHVFDMDDF